MKVVNIDKLLIVDDDDVVTMSGCQPRASAVGIYKDTITFVGTEEEAEEYMTKRHVEKIDLRGKCILPGIIDPHVHPISEAEFEDHVDLNGFEGDLDAEGIVELLKERASKVTCGGWVIAKGFNPMFVRDAPKPSMAMLDQIINDKPVLIISQNMHTYYANTLAFQEAGVDENTPDPLGGTYERDENGKLTGQFKEPPAALPFIRKMPKFNYEETKEKLRSALHRFAKAGYATICEMSMMSSGTLSNHCAALEEVSMEKDCPVRMFTYQNPTNFDIPDYVPIETERTDNYYCLGYKFWCDGSPYGGTMAVRDAYMDTDLTKALGFPEAPCFGMLTQTYESLYKAVFKYASEGRQLAAHCHGERGINLVLDVYEAVLKALNLMGTDHRFRLEHCGLITKDQLARAEKIGATVSFFIGHVYYLGHRLRDEIIGEERAERFMPVHSAARAGHRWSLHADSPCFPITPFPIIRTAVTRWTRVDPYDGESSQIGSEECVTIEEALAAVTKNAAWQLFQEDRLGQIKEGYQADFTIVDKNPLTIDPMELDTIKTEHLFKAGSQIF